MYRVSSFGHNSHFHILYLRRMSGVCQPLDKVPGNHQYADHDLLIYRWIVIQMFDSSSLEPSRPWDTHFRIHCLPLHARNSHDLRLHNIEPYIGNDYFDPHCVIGWLSVLCQ